MSSINITVTFSIGQIIQHKLFNYRGVIFEIDPKMMLGDEWYEQVAKSRPPKDEPWYHVMVDNAVHSTYVAQQNLQPSKITSTIEHPYINQIFSRFTDGYYHLPKNRLQ